MDKDSMPKLELDGFAYEAGRKKRTNRASEGWTTKAGRFAKSAIKDLRTPKSSDNSYKDEPDIKYRRMLIKTGACAIIAVIILGIASINTQNADAIKQAISSTVNHEFDMDEDIGKLKFVDNLNDDTESVFSPLPDSAAVYPAEDYNIVTAFGQEGSKGVRLKTEGTGVLNIAKGVVTKIGKTDGSEYVQIKLDTGEIVFYYGVDPTVKVDDIVTAGQSIGDVAGDYLYVELKQGDKFIDPISYVEEREAAAVKNAS